MHADRNQGRPGLTRAGNGKRSAGLNGWTAGPLVFSPFSFFLAFFFLNVFLWRPFSHILANHLIICLIFWWPSFTHQTICDTLSHKFSHNGWLRSAVCGMSVFGRRTDPVLRSACSWRVTTMWANRPLQVSQLGQLSLSSFRCRYMSTWVVGRFISVRL